MENHDYSFPIDLKKIKDDEWICEICGDMRTIFVCTYSDGKLHILCLTCREDKGKHETILNN